MTRSEEKLHIARYIAFEILELLWMAATVLIFWLGTGGALYLFTASQEAAVLQAFTPDGEKWLTQGLMAAFPAAWCFTLYFWRRRGGLLRLIGQGIALLCAAGAALLWGALAAAAIAGGNEGFFWVVPCLHCALALGTGVLCALPIPALIRFVRAQRRLGSAQMGKNGKKAEKQGKN